MIRAYRVASATFVLIVLVGLGVRQVPAQSPPEPKGGTGASGTGAKSGLADASLPLRAALHRDPTLDAPLERLVTMYREAGKLTELVEIYQKHVAAYPTDASGATVLVRLLAADNRPDALNEARSATLAHPQNGYLHYLLYTLLRRDRLSGALDELSKAIELTDAKHQKTAWIDVMLTEAASERQDLLDRHLQSLAAMAATADEQLRAAEKMIRFKRHKPALELLAKAAAQQTSAQLGVEIELAAASAQVGLDDMEGAAKRLDKLLARLAPDYWQRDEIVRRRIALVRTSTEREAMLSTARRRLEQHPRDENAAIELARLLIAFELRRDALDVLLRAGSAIADSERLEKLTLELFDRLRDERARQSYLAARLGKFPARGDLRVASARALFLIGERAAAQEQLEKAFAQLPTAERVKQLVDFARYLRTVLRPADAAGILQTVVRLDPTRIEFRRELAELYLILGERKKARNLFSEGLPKDAKVENLADLAQFLVQHELYSEARHLLEVEIPKDDTNLELRLALADIHRRLANREEGELLLDEARKIADTISRYRAWLDAAIAFYQDKEEGGKFLEAEIARIDEERKSWDEKSIERLVNVLDAAVRTKTKFDVGAVLNRYLQLDVPEELRIQFRQLLVRTLESDPAKSATTYEQLEQLIKDDPRHADEYRVRLVTIAQRQGQGVVNPQLLLQIDVDAIQDSAILAQFELLARSVGLWPQVAAAEQRLIALDPGNRGAWQRWFERLALAGSEERLREAIGRILAGVNQIPIDPERRKTLQQYITDSYWRSIVRQISAGHPSALSDSLAMLDGIEKQSVSPEQAMWIAWNRAYLLARLGRTQARDEAERELDRLAAEIIAAKSKSADDKNAAEADVDNRDPAVRLPDGLILPLSTAHKLIRNTASTPVAPISDGRMGPVPELKAKWQFETDSNSPIGQVVPTKDGSILVTSSTGDLYCLEAASGKLRWRERGLFAAPAFDPNQGYNNQLGPPSKLLVDQDQRIIFGNIGSVACRSVATGQELWRADIGKVTPTPGRGYFPRVTVFLHGSQVIAYNPASDTVTAIAPSTGKILRTVTLPDGQRFPAEPLGWFNSGAALEGNRLFVYGNRSALINAQTFAVEWILEPEGARTFPIELAAAATAAPAATPPVTRPPGTVNATVPATMNLMSGRMRYWRPTPSFSIPAQQTAYISYQQPANLYGGGYGPMALVGAAATWDSFKRGGNNRMALLERGKLVLIAGNHTTVMPLELPLASQTREITGTLVGTCGSFTVSMNAWQLNLVDLGTGQTAIFDCAKVSGGQPMARSQAVVDGPLVYVVGPGGIMAINALMGKQLYRIDWPEAVAPDDNDLAALPNANTSFGMNANYRMGGYYGSPSLQYMAQGVVVSGMGPGLCLPMAGAVDRGVLYVTPSAARLVALVEGPRAMSTVDEQLFDPEFLGRLRTLFFKLRKRKQMKRKGIQPTPAAGFTREFKDHRHYTPGDDFRAIDWRLYARLEKIFIRIFEEIQEFHVHILVDRSRSMVEPYPEKRVVALRLAVAVGYLALVSGHRVSLMTLGDDVRRELRPLKGQGHIHELLGLLGNLEFTGGTDLVGALRRFRPSRDRRGIVFVISDLLGGLPELSATALEQAITWPAETHAIQVLSPEEIRPKLEGEIRLVDVETGELRRVWLTQREMQRYQQEFEGYLEDLRNICMRNQIDHLTWTTDRSFEEMFLHLLSRGSALAGT